MFAFNPENTLFHFTRLSSQGFNVISTDTFTNHSQFTMASLLSAVFNISARRSVTFVKDK